MGWGGQFYFAISVGIISTALGRAANTNREEEKKDKGRPSETTLF